MGGQILTTTSNMATRLADKLRVFVEQIECRCLVLDEAEKFNSPTVGGGDESPQPIVARN
jgi:hypothetical protein